MAKLTGTNGPDFLVGTASADTITGNGGNDTIAGDLGNDLIAGDDSNNNLCGDLDNSSSGVKGFRNWIKSNSYRSDLVLHLWLQARAKRNLNLTNTTSISLTKVS